jgi:protein-L-isoaspartate O-methyltransferase
VTMRQAVLEIAARCGYGIASDSRIIHRLTSICR